MRRRPAWPTMRTELQARRLLVAAPLGRALPMKIRAGCSRVWLALALAIGSVLPAHAQATAPPAASSGSKNLAPGFGGPAAKDPVVVMPVDVELFSLSA